MLKHLQKLLLIAALCVPWVTQAQTTTLTVADGTETNDYIPVYGYYADENQHNQFIYPASLLNDLGGGMITKMTFYMSSPASSAWGISATVSITEVSGTTVTSIMPTTDATEVWTGTMNGTTSTWEIEFTTPYVYGGGNLLIDITTVTAGDYSSCSWTGISQTSAALCTYGSSTSAQNFLPKVTFEYEPVGDFCFAPSTPTASIDGSDVDITWVDTNASQWQVTWGTGTFSPDTIYDNTTITNTPSYSFSSLDDGYYTVYVRAICGPDDSSSWRSTSFMIGGCSLTIVGADSFGDGWNGGTINVTMGGQTTPYTMTSGSSATWQLLVPSNTPVSFSWTSGSFDSEVSFTIYHQSGAALFSASTPTAGTFLTLSDPCSSCFAPGNLTIDSLTSDFARASWGGSADGYGIIWGTSADVLDDNGTETVSTDPYFEMDNLTAGTGYTIRVWTLCDDNETSDTVTLTFSTIGEAVSEFPYVTGFEPTDDIAWSFVNDANNKWFIGTATNNGGTNSLYISNDNGVSNGYTNSFIQFSYAYRPLSIAESGQFAISFDWKAYGESNYDYLRAWIAPASAQLTAGHDPEGGTSAYNYTNSTPAGWIDLGGKMNLQSDWQTTVATPSISSPGSYFLVFMWANDGSGGSTPAAAVDNIMMTTLTCPAPTALQATNVTSDSISVSWNAGGSETSWILTITPGNDVYELNNTSYDFDQLQPNTNYTIRVYSVCSDEDTSLPTSINVRTACGAVTELPIFENFETSGTTSSSNNNFIPCWTKLNNATSYYYPYVSNSTTYNHTPGGSNGIYWYNTTTTGTYGDYQVLVLPEIDTNALPVNTTQLSFWARSSSSSYYPVLYVGVMSDPDSINTFQYFDTIEVGNSTQWQKYTTYFANFTGEGQYIAIRADRPSSSWYVYVDDITLDSLRSCFEPVSVNVLSAVQPDSVVVNWTPNTLGNNAGYELVVGPAGFNPDTATNIITLTDTVYTFTNLFGGVTYDFYVRTDCGSDGYSHWTEPMSFSPGQYVIGTAGSGSVTMCGGIIYDDGGPNGQYSNNVDYQLTVYPSSPDSMLTFYGSAYTESSLDYLRIYEGVGTNGNLLWQTSTSSQLDNIPLTTCMSGPITLHFHTDGSVIYDGFDVHVNCIAAPECAAVENLQVTAGPVSAIATWNQGFFGEYNGATVEYKEDTASEWTLLPMTTNTYIAINGLTPNTDYDLRVASDCNGFTANYTTTTFSTRDFGCLVSDPTQSHNDTVTGAATTSYNIPVNNFYNNTFSEQLYTSSDLGGAGTLVSFSLNYGYTSPMTVKNNCMVYMGNTTVTSLSYSNYVDPSTMTLVYSGPLNCSQGWNEFTLTTPFNYSGGNLVVAVVDNSGDYNSSSYVWNCHSASNMAFSWYSDSYTYPNSSMSKVNHAFRPDMIFSFLSCVQYSTCAAPPTAVVDVTTTTVDVAWAPGNTETSWNVYYRQAGAPSFTQAATGVTATSYQFTNLNPGTNYEFKVEGVCDTQLLASTVSVSTLCAMISSLPYTEDFNSWGTGSLPNCWYNTGAYSTGSYSIISGTQNLTGTNGGSIYMYSSSGTSYVSRIIMPALDTNIYQANQTQVVFYVKYTSTSYGAPRFNVGVMDDANDLSSWTTVATVQHSGQLNVWEPFEVPLDTYTGTGSHIGIQTEYPGTYFYCYLDNVTLEQIPTCPRPDSLMATGATSSSVDLSWHERGNASNWIVEYGPRGFVPGTGTTVAVSSNPFTLTGLTAGYQGEYYVKSVCGAGDTGEYSRIPCLFGTSQIPATLPYSYDFENEAEWGNWQTSSNVAIDWYRGNAVANNGGYSMYVSADQGTTYTPYNNNAVVNAAAYRDIDFGNVQSSFTISFDARVGGTLSASYDGLMLFLVDPSIATVASNDNITSPWGNVNDLYRVATVRLDTVWHTHQASFDTISGIKRVAFFWFNQNTGASYPALLEPAAIDNIHIEESACPRPIALTVDNVGGSTAQLSWMGPAQTTYQVIYRPYPNGTSNSYVTTNTNSVTLTGLESMTQYVAWVRKICGTDTSLTCDGILFTTDMCDNGVTVTNFDTTMATTTSTYSPIGYSTYNYSYTQTIIDSAQLAELAGDITAFAFSANNTTASSYFTNMTVYMANVPDSVSDLSSSFIHPSTDIEFVKVIDSADFSYGEVGMHFHAFDTAFTWDGHSNILFSVAREHGTWSSGATFDAHTQASGKMRYAYTDNGPYDYMTVSGGYTATAVGDIYLISCGVGCHAPAVLPASDVTYQSATVNWSSNATDFEVAVKAATDPTWPAEVAVSNATSYAVSNLAPATTYQFRVRAICDAVEALVSDWVDGTFVTDSLPCFVPEDLHAVETGYTTATLAWTADASQSQWSIRVWNTAGGNDHTVSANPFTVTGLAQNTTYYAAIKAICGGGAAESEYGDTIQFTTGQCDKVEDVSVSGITTNSAVVSWTSTGAPKYKVEYGDRNFNQGQGTTVVVEDGSTSVTLNNLRVNHNYSVFVMAVCEEGAEGAWSDRVDFATLDETGVDVVDGSTNLSIYPNPTSDATTIALSGVNGEVTITIVDMNGRTVATESMSCEGDCTKRMEVSGLAQGSYFVRVSGEGVNQIKKLVVK